MMGICGRDGLGKLRHIDRQCLWLQKQVRSGALWVRKVKGTDNPADAMTKALAQAEIDKYMKMISQHVAGGRAEKGLDIVSRLKPVKSFQVVPTFNEGGVKDYDSCETRFALGNMCDND